MLSVEPAYHEVLDVGAVMATVGATTSTILKLAVLLFDTTLLAQSRACTCILHVELLTLLGTVHEYVLSPTVWAVNQDDVIAVGYRIPPSVESKIL